MWHFLAEQPPGCAHEHLPGRPFIFCVFMFLYNGQCVSTFLLSCLASPDFAWQLWRGNQSGVKVIVAGLAKCGTRTICHALNEIGFNAQHSEEAALPLVALLMLSCTVCWLFGTGFPFLAMVGLCERGLRRIAGCF